MEQNKEEFVMTNVYQDTNQFLNDVDWDEFGPGSLQPVLIGLTFAIFERISSIYAEDKDNILITEKIIIDNLNSWKDQNTLSMTNVMTQKELENGSEKINNHDNVISLIEFENSKKEI